MAVQLGELLLKEKRITPAQLQEALDQQREHGGRLGFNLIKIGFVKDEEITARSSLVFCLWLWESPSSIDRPETKTED